MIASKIAPEVSPRNGKSSYHLVEDDSEGKQIRSCVQFLAPDLLRRHIHQRSNRRALSGHFCVQWWARRRHSPALNWCYLCQTKIQNLGVPALGNENVGRLDIAMNDTFTVGRFQRVCDFDSQAERTCSRGLPGCDASTSGLP